MKSEGLEVRGWGCHDGGRQPASDKWRSCSLQMAFLLPVNGVPAPCKERNHPKGKGNKKVTGNMLPLPVLLLFA